MAGLPALALGLVAVGIVVAACGSGPAPTSAGSTGHAPETFLAPEGSAADGPAIVDQLGGAWRPDPIVVDDARIAIVSDACAARARTDLGETEANLPTALIDARGEHLVTLIMADDLNAILCLARLDDGGSTATVDSVDRLSAKTTTPVDGTSISIASVVPLTDRPAGRMLALGRLGPDAATARIGLGEGTSATASTGDGWWAIWWAGSEHATTFSAVDAADQVVGTAKAPATPFEARTRRALWWLNPAMTAPTATSTTVHALVRDPACPGGGGSEAGDAAANRVEPPAVDLENATVTVTIDVRRQPGDESCPAGAPFPLTITLPEPLGSRALLDGGSNPPRDARQVPAG